MTNPTSTQHANRPLASKLALFFILCAVAVPILTAVIAAQIYHPGEFLVGSDVSAGRAFLVNDPGFTSLYFDWGIVDGYYPSRFFFILYQIFGFDGAIFGINSAMHMARLVDIINPTPFMITVGFLAIAWAVRRANNSRKYVITRFLLPLAIALAAEGGLAIWLEYAKAYAFYTPSDFSTNHIRSGQRVWLGGIVVAGSISHVRGSPPGIMFTVTDKIKDMKVSFPDLLRLQDGKCVVAEGELGPTGAFIASTVATVTDHAAEMLPKAGAEAVEALTKKGLCQE